jgi:hypothetical protein
MTMDPDQLTLGHVGTSDLLSLISLFKFTCPHTHDSQETRGPAATGTIFKY